MAFKNILRLKDMSTGAKDKQGGAIVELARAIQHGLGEALQGLTVAKWLKECAEICGDAGLHLEYTVPSGFKVVHAYYQLRSGVH